MKREILGTHQKALQVNLDPGKYGAFAEIGAGQEVTRWFFRVGGASGTIAKTISAYDMTVSDSIYGHADRYVSQQRLVTMLDHEYGLMVERLAAKRGDTTKFFAFADTVAAKSYTRKDDAHGWLGIRFQTAPNHEPSQIIIHVRLWDKENIQEQEALGILGVNLIHSALYLHHDVDLLVESLIDSLSLERIEIDMMKCTGPAFAGLDNRLLSLKLVQMGLTNAAMFMANGENVQPADVLYKKAILVERGSFRPVTNTTLDMLRSAQAMFVQEPRVQGEEFIVLMEMTQKNLVTEQGIDHKDFLERVDMLAALGKNVLISNYGEYHRLAAYLFRHTKKMIGIVMGVPSLREIFDEKYYANLEGGILESFGRLFKNDLKIYAYPLMEDKSGSLITAGNLRVAPHLRHLYSYLLENRFIDGIRDYNEKYLSIFSRDVLSKIRGGDPAWEGMVPEAVGHLIKERKLLGYREPAVKAAA
jgi:hypothetical protein